MNLETSVSVMVWLRATSIRKVRQVKWMDIQFYLPYSLGMSRCTLCCSVPFVFYVVTCSERYMFCYILRKKLQPELVCKITCSQYLFSFQYLFQERTCVEFAIITNLPMQGNLEQKLSQVFLTFGTNSEVTRYKDFARCQCKCIKQSRTNSAFRIQFCDSDGSVWQKGPWIKNWTSEVNRSDISMMLNSCWDDCPLFSSLIYNGRSPVRSIERIKILLIVVTQMTTKYPSLSGD